MSFAHGLHVWKCSSPPVVSCQMSGWNVTEYVTLCCCLWWLSYWFLLLTTKQSKEWSCRLLALYHGCSVSFSALQDIAVNKNEAGFQNDSLTEYQKNYLSYMLSYFLFDVIWIQFYGNETWIIYFHHITSILIILKILVSKYGGVLISYGVAGLELTNPYLQCRWFLRTHGYLNTPIHTAVEIWFFILFLIVRLLGGSIIAYNIVKSPGVDIYMKTFVVAIYLISWTLAWQIVMYVRKKYWNRRRESRTSMVDVTPHIYDDTHSQNVNATGNTQQRTEKNVHGNGESVEGPSGNNGFF